MHDNDTIPAGTHLDDLDPEDAWFGDPDEDDGVTLPVREGEEQ